MPRFAPSEELLRHLAPLHRELGIPASYASDRGLTPHPEADKAELIDVGLNDEGRPIRLVGAAAEAWVKMRSTAASQHIELVPVSGFRAVARQAEILREKLAAGQRLEDILSYLAAPGFSEHHTGRALDIGSSENAQLEEEFALTSAFRWLEQHASAFGFVLSYPRGNPHGIVYEPWHWCWHPLPGGSNARILLPPGAGAE